MRWPSSRRSPRSASAARPTDYDVDGKRVFRKGSPGTGMTYGQAAQRAIELGGKYDGHELPKDINPMTHGLGNRDRRHGPGRRGQGQPAGDGRACRLCRGVRADRARSGNRQVRDHRLPGRGRLRHGHPSRGPGNADQERRGAGLRRRRHSNASSTTRRTACPPASGSTRPSRRPMAMWRGASAPARWTSPILPARWAPRASASRCWVAPPRRVLCAISEAIGGHVFNRTPVVPDMILNHLAGRPQSHGPLQVNCQ